MACHEHVWRHHARIDSSVGFATSELSGFAVQMCIRCQLCRIVHMTKQHLDRAILEHMEAEAMRREFSIPSAPERGITE